MSHAFVDTNILIDLIADRKPFSRFAVELFEKAETNTVKLYTSSHSFATTHYLMKKYTGEKELRALLSDLLYFITIIPVDLNVIQKSLRSSYKDFEDAIQIMAAQSVSKISYLITRNIKDFRDCPIEVVAPDEFCSRVK
ncbi:type II toxin-antitoxin system VapC family toxin [Niabella soli]|uniref:Twitching motility protein PilT n=1 Tax=Niabella soli DSM 19437 TaxID=929713 RepID=W0EZZ6_9BACT|nr:PIN domain-containing protein [Niabella soli]AHF16380.1 twitching motility protein PilT [Niabella soli DSM 19437]